MTLIVVGEAGEEFAESVQYYESKEVGPRRAVSR